MPRRNVGKFAFVIPSSLMDNNRTRFSFHYDCARRCTAHHDRHDRCQSRHNSKKYFDPLIHTSPPIFEEAESIFRRDFTCKLSKRKSRNFSKPSLP